MKFRCATYLFCHHLKEDIKHFITNANNALHHACRDKNRIFINAKTQEREK